MLPNFHHQRYHEFSQALEQLQQTASGAIVDVPKLRQSFLKAQQFFQQQIINLDADDLEPDIQPQVQSYQTEISKQLRLLGMDVMFLQAARQPGTAQERQSQILHRIQTLHSYCNAILQNK